MGPKDVTPPLPPSELSQLWSGALDSYEKITGKAVKNLPSPNNMDEIIGFAEQETNVFGNARHPKGKFNAIRAYLGKNIDYIDTAAEFIADATTAVFPPSKAIYAVISYMLKAAKKVSAALDTIAKCFDEMNTVLERINFLDERKLPNIPGYKTCIMRVFTSLLSIFGISTRYLKSGRAMTFFSKLVKGDDDELQDAYDGMIQAIQRLDPATNMATLRKVGDVELRLIDVQEGVVSGFAAQANQGKAIEAKQDEMLVALAKFRREMATYTTPKDIQDSKEKDRSTQKSSGKSGSSPRIVALNTIQRVLDSPARPSMQFEEIEQLIVPGTSKWFTSEASYYSWLEKDDKPVLLIRGDNGTGKTFMAFSIIQELYALRDIHPGTSVAYIFFKEQHVALRSVRFALCSMCTQVAESNTSYCEKVSTLIDSYDWDKFGSVKQDEIWQKFFLDQYTLPVSKEAAQGANNALSRDAQQQSTTTEDETDYETTAATVAHDLTQHKHEIITKDDNPILYLVFDGLDELPVVGRELLISLMKSIKPSTYRVKILLTSRSEMYLEDFVKDINPIVLDLSHEKTVDDIRRLAQARCESLPRLRRFRSHSKKQIVSQFQVLGREKGIGLLYVDRALQYLDSIGREGAVLRVLEQLPPDLDSLYGKVLSDCSSRRSPEEAEALKLLFALLAFAKRPLTLKEVRWFLKIAVPMDALYVDDEIRDRCASMVDLFRSLKYEAQSKTPSWQTESPPEITPASVDSSAKSDVDDDVPLSFQERSLREFFRKPGPSRFEAHTAHLKMFLTCIEVLCNSRNDMDEESRMGLTSYAATTWLEHLSDIDLPSATSTQVTFVLEALTRLFTNKNNAAAIIEKTSYEIYNQLGLVTAQSTNSHRQNLLKWANSATLLPKSIFSSEAWSWATRLASGDLDLTYDLTKAHVLNWFNTKDVASAQKTFYTAWLAMRSTRIRDSIDSTPGTSISAQQTQKLASAFDSVQPTPQASRAVCLQQSAYYYKEALQAGKRALSDKLPPNEQFYTWVILSSVCCNLASADWFDPSEEYDSDNDNTRHRHPIRKGETHHALSAQAYAEKALAVYPENDVAALPEHERWHIQQAYINIACAKRARGLYEEAIEGYARAKTLGFRQGYCLLQIVVIMSQQRQYDKLTALIQGWSTFDRSYLLALNDQDNWTIHGLFQKAAVKAGKETFMVEVYQELITVLDRDGNATLLRYWLASANYRIFRNTDKAKALLNELLDGTSAKDPVTGEDDTYMVSHATSMAADIIYDQFRKATNRDEKSALLQELAFLPGKQLGGLSDFQLYDSQYAIVYARMLRKMRSANDYHDFMEQAFQACMQRLTDSQGGNDGSSFSFLASILIVLGGMERDAKIALSCQFSITDPKVDHTVYSSSDESDTDEETSSDEDENSEKSTDDDSEMKSTTSSVKEKHPKTPTEATSSKLKTPVIDDDEGDLAPDFYLGCDGPCERDMRSWKQKDPKTKESKTRKIYTCLICTNIDLCEDCYQRRIAEDAGKRKPYWRMYCGKDHEYMSGPIEQWRGVKAGVIRVGDSEEEFKVWLDGVKERWTSRWKEFWKG